MMHRFISILFCFYIALYGIAQVTFNVKAPSKADINGQIRLQFELNGAQGGNFQPPSLKDFDILAGPNVSSSNSVTVINGRTQTFSSTTYTYILAPKKNGALQVGSASVNVQGKTYHTRPVTVQVSGKANPNAAASSSASQASANIQPAGSHIGANDIYFTAEVSKQKIYEQEPIMLTYRYHIREGVAVVNIMPTGKPEMKGFWTQEVNLPRNLSPEAARIGGKLYRVGKNLQYLIFPQQSGKLNIPALSFRTDVVQRYSGIDEIDAFFNGGNNTHLTIERSAPSVAVEVLPLPQPQPTNFSGGVGQLSIKASLVTPMPKTNDVATLRIVVTGTGNLKLVKAPIVNFPKGFDTYSPKTNDKVRITPSGIEGTMEFDYTFVPRNIGKFTIPPVTLVYFDPQRKSYVTSSTQAIQLNIAKGTKAYTPIGAGSAEDIKDIDPKLDSHFTPSGALWIGSWSYWGLLAVILALCVLGNHFVQRIWEQHSDKQGRITKKAGKRAHKRLLQAQQLINADQSSSFYDALSAAITSYFAEKFKLDKAALTQQKIQEQLEAHDVSSELIGATKSILSDIDFGRFAPSSENTRQELYQRASNLLTSLNDSLR